MVGQVGLEPTTAVRHRIYSPGWYQLHCTDLYLLVFPSCHLHASVFIEYELRIQFFGSWRISRSDFLHYVWAGLATHGFFHPCDVLPNCNGFILRCLASSGDGGNGAIRTLAPLWTTSQFSGLVSSTTWVHSQSAIPFTAAIANRLWIVDPQVCTIHQPAFLTLTV